MTTASRKFLLLGFAILLVSNQTFAQQRPQDTSADGAFSVGTPDPTRPRPGGQQPGGQRPGGNRPGGQQPGGQQPQPQPQPIPHPGPGTGHQPWPQPQPQPWPQPIPQPIPQPLPQVSVIHEQVRQVLFPGQVLRVAQLLRLSPREVRELDVVSVTILGQALRGRSVLSLQSLGRPLVAPQALGPYLTQIHTLLPSQVELETLDLISQGESSIESITLEVRRDRRPGPGVGIPVQPNQMITLHLGQVVRGSAVLPLKQLALQQLGVSLEGAEIERIVIEGQSQGYATAQVELNGRIVTQEVLSMPQGRKPIRMTTNEPIRGTLRLHVSGSVHIQSINIRVGRVNGRGR